MSITFQGRAALVTGAARPRGIGRATALRLAEGGADVACLDIAGPYAEAPAHATASADDLRDVVERIEALGRRAVAVRADVSDGAQVEAAVHAASEALGTITLAANVAGGSGPGFGLGPLVDLPEPEFRRVLDEPGTGARRAQPEPPADSPEWTVLNCLVHATAHMAEHNGHLESSVG
jgi:NAD(P)-dependent dehydrogenase (short-subunit alcohol dehydrogenase family)